MARRTYHSENYGGAREGAGRKKIGESRPLRINLPEDDWKKIESLIENGHAASFGDYFRQLHQNQYGKDPEV